MNRKSIITHVHVLYMYLYVENPLPVMSLSNCRSDSPRNIHTCLKCKHFNNKFNTLCMHILALDRARLV